MSLLDFFTGGNASDARDALNKAKDIFGNLQTPTQAQLTLPELQKYVQAGVMTPAQAEAALVSGNAYDNLQTSSAPVESEMSALNKLQSVADAQGMTPQMKAQLQDALNQVKTQEQGQNGAILDQMAARGIPTSLMGTAAQLANAGQGAESANKAATDAAGQAEQNALQALSTGGQMAGQVHGQQYQEQANKAAAQNAINQWNAQNQTGVNLANTGYRQAANEANFQNAQNVSNQNVQQNNARTQYNAQLPETVYQNNLQKAQGQAGAYTNIGNMAQNQGKQNAGITSGIINTIMQFMPKPGMAGGQTPPGFNASYSEDMLPGGSQSTFTGYAHGGIAIKPSHEGLLHEKLGIPQGESIPAKKLSKAENSQSPALRKEATFAENAKHWHHMEGGGKVPGRAVVPGDSTRNDRVPAMLSAGEVVIPRSIAPHPDLVKSFVTNLMHKKVAPVHPDDIRSVLDALSQRRA